MHPYLVLLAALLYSLAVGAGFVLLVKKITVGRETPDQRAAREQS
jgi:hypothetical protein